jgi:uncharacterized iron-regulated membrane protein
MYRFVRKCHRIIGLINALFLIVISVTGFLLALKRQIPWMRPAIHQGTDVAAMAEWIPPGAAVEAAIAVGLPSLQSAKDVDRLEIHAKYGVYKITSRQQYDEVQVDLGTGKVLSVAKRNDQLTEDIHDLSFIDPALRLYVLPVVATLLFGLGVSGLVLYFVPVLRRARFLGARRREGLGG